MRPEPSSPYKGLNAFDDSELDALLFFGREREREIVVANLIASRLTVLYGPSGVGKSSLLSAAVARSLRELPEGPLVVVLSRWSEDPAAALADAVAEGLEEPTNGSRSPLEALERAQADRDVYVVLDQTEEYFLYHAEDDGEGSFAEVLPAVLAAPYRVNVLVSLREDSLAKLDRFTGRIAGLFANTLRLDRLDRRSAQAAIVRPVERFAELTGETITIEPELVERVLDEVGAGQIEPALGGLGTVERAVDGARVEAPYLQLVMQRLWDEERTSGSETLRLETLERLGGAQRIVEEHLESALAGLTPEQKDVAARLFNHLVTPSGTKIAHELSDLADFGHASTEELRPVLARLGESRILRSFEEGEAVRYEIFHDVLAEPVLAWRARHRTEREVERQLAAAHERRSRLQRLLALALVALGLMVAVTVFAFSQRSNARDQAREAKVNELDARSASELASDPEESLRLALRAARLVSTRGTEDALRQALKESHVRSVFRLGEPLVGATVRDGVVLAATADGDVVVVDAHSGRVRDRIRTGAPPWSASFARDGTALLAGKDGRLRVVRPTGDLAAVPAVDGAISAEILPDARRALVIDDGGVRLTDLETGRVLQTFPHRSALSAAMSRAGRRVVTGGADDTVRLWSVASGGLLRRLRGQSGDALAVAYSPRGDLVASASSDGLGRVWDVETGRQVTALVGHGNYVTDVAFSKDGTQVVTASRDDTARVFRADTGMPLLTLAGHTDRVNSAAFLGPAGSKIVTASADGTVRVWDAVVQPDLRELSTFGDPVVDVVYADGDRRVVATTADGKGAVIDAATGKELRSTDGASRPRTVVGAGGRTATIRGNTVVLRSDGETRILRGHRDRVTSVSFSSDGSQVVTASRDHDARIWDVATGQTVHRLQGHFGVVNDARFSPDGRWVVTAGPRTAGLWDARSGTLVYLLRGHVGKVLSAGFDSTGRLIVTGGEDGTVRTYVCQICGGLDVLVPLAEHRLASTGSAP